MTDESYRSPPEQIDMAEAERAIRRAGTIALFVTLAAAAAGYLLLPRLFEFPTQLAERLAFAVQASALVLFVVLVAVGMVSTARRKSPEDIGGSAAGPPSEGLAIYAAFLQNTLEQAVLAVGLYLAMATLVQGPWLSLIVVGVVLFVIGRVAFLRGYPKGARGRALGMTLTMMPTILGYVAVIVLLGWRLFE
jgi:uncharacterized membrane protein YecN with MAPEG domain